MTVVVLGTITFADFEVPNTIPWGGKQAITRHAMIGGGAVLDVMGPEDTDLSWDGIFLGPMSELRARRVDLLRRSGRKVTLSWARFIYEVVVVGFRGDYQRSNHIPYHIELAVVRDLVAETLGPMVERLEDALKTELEEAFGAAGGDPLLQGAVRGAQTAITQFVTGGNYSLSGLSVAAQAGLQSTMAESAVISSNAAAQADAGLTSSTENMAAGRDPAALATAAENQSTAATASSRAHATTARLNTARSRLAIPMPPPPAPPVTTGGLAAPSVAPTTQQLIDRVPRGDPFTPGVFGAP